MDNFSQIFQTNSPSRWKRIKWTGRIIFLITLFVLGVVVLAIILAQNPSSSILPGEYTSNKGIPPSHYKKINAFKDFLDKKEKEDLRKRQSKNVNKTSGQFIRAAFYTPWSRSNAEMSLDHNGDKINVIFPEWFFIDTNDNIKLQTRIDSAGLSLMRQKNLRILPMLTNFNSSKKDKEGRLAPDFDGSLIHGILNDTVKQKIFIQQLVDTLTAYNFQGINIDFEELTEPTNKPLSRFQKNLYNALHERNMLVTQDISEMNDDYDSKQLANYNDYVVLMAYDHFNNSTGPGPICDQKWVEDVLDGAAKKIDSKKIILGLGGYGYDWQSWTNEDGTKDSMVTDLTYSEAIDKAKVSNATIDFDNDNYNLHFTYTQKLGDNDPVTKHDVWFTDAATIFNIMRFADEYGVAGTALWRMGSQDARTWSFYNLDLDNQSLQKNPFNFGLLSAIPVSHSQKPSAVGQPGGEILNILSSPQEGKINLEVDSAEQLISEQVYTQLPSGYIYEKSGEDATVIGPGHKIILTFDDGPSDEYTPQILDILEKEKIPATFFIVGLEAEKNLPVLKRIYKDGFEIGNHTFTHHNIATMSPERADVEMKATRLLIEAVTDHSTILFRAPYNADSEPQTFEEIEPLARSKKDNYITVGESIDPNDWDARNNADSIVARTIRIAESTNGNIVLLHDAGGESRQATIDALPRIIKYFRDKGCKFTTVADLMGKTKKDVMPPVKQDWESTFNYIFIEFIYWAGKIIFSLFLIGIFLSIGRMFLMALLAWLQKRTERKLYIPLPVPFAGQPLVSIIVPAFNEELNATRTVLSLLSQDYPNLEIVFVDDGSKDSTFKTVQDAFAGNDKVRVFTKPNGGKASALNLGVEKATGEFVVCIDADTQLKTDAISLLMQKFFETNKRDKAGAQVGAVAGNVKVGNERNMITKWQSIEYITSQNFDRRAFDYLNCITVIPGAIGAFRKEAIINAGSFTSDTLAEDCDLTMRLHRKGYIIRNCNTAISYTEAPETMRQFMKQRFRWSFGVMQCFWKHRDAVLNPKYKNFGMIAMPHILIFQMILPFLAPLADLVLVISLIAAAFNVIPASAGHIVLYYIIFSLVDMAGAALAFAYEKEDYKKLLWMIPQRFIYRQLMYYILFKSFNKALKGEMQGWGVLKRTGNVKQMASA